MKPNSVRDGVRSLICLYYGDKEQTELDCADKILTAISDEVGKMKTKIWINKPKYGEENQLRLEAYRRGYNKAISDIHDLLKG